MKLTATNLDEILYDNGYLVVARIGADGYTHQGKIHPHETVTYSTPVVYNDTDSLSHDLDIMDNSVAALVRKYPHRPTQKYVVKYGEVL